MGGASVTAQTRALLTVQDIASLTPFSPDTVVKAIKATDPAVFPPPLRAKRDSRGRFLIIRRDFDAWLESLQDA